MVCIVVHKNFQFSTTFRRIPQHCATCGRLNATKPRKLPYAASVSTSIRSARVLAGLRRPLRRRTSIRRFVQATFDLRLPSPFLHLRATRRSPVIVASDVIASYKFVAAACKWVSARNRACPQETFVVHGDSQHSPQCTTGGAIVAWADGARWCAGHAPFAHPALRSLGAPAPSPILGFAPSRRPGKPSCPIRLRTMLE